jgi:hypothetical protein
MNSRLFPLLAAFLVVILIQGCNDPILRETAERQFRDNDNSDAQSLFLVSEDGEVQAAGPVQFVAERSFGLEDATFLVTAQTEIHDFSHSAVDLKEVEVGMFLQVRGFQHGDGSVEAASAEVSDDADDDSTSSGVKKLICHIPPGNPNNARTHSIDSLSVPNHLRHGDLEGECPEVVITDRRGNGRNGQFGRRDIDDADDDSTSSGVKKLICHIPPGNPNNARTHNIDSLSVTSHLRHGDLEGECPDVITIDHRGNGRNGRNGRGDIDDDGECLEEDEVEICHIPAGKPDKAKTQSVCPDDALVHLSHGDLDVACPPA